MENISGQGGGALVGVEKVSPGIIALVHSHSGMAAPTNKTRLRNIRLRDTQTSQKKNSYSTIQSTHNLQST